MWLCHAPKWTKPLPHPLGLDLAEWLVSEACESLKYSCKFWSGLSEFWDPPWEGRVLATLISFGLGSRGTCGGNLKLTCILVPSRVHPQAYMRVTQHWLMLTVAEAEAPTLWPPDVKSRLTGKDPDAEKDWGQEQKGVVEDEMVGWHQRPNGHEFEQITGDSEGKRSQECCSPWGCKETDTTERLNNKIHEGLHLRESGDLLPYSLQ